MNADRSKLIFGLVLIWHCCLGLASGQIRSDFVLADGGFDVSMAFDHEGRLHVTWFDQREHTWKVYYGLFDSLGNVLKNPQWIASCEICQLPSLVVREDRVVVVWRWASLFGNEIQGQFFPIEGGAVPGIVTFSDVQDDESYTAFSPSVAFLDDSTFVVVWSDARASKQGIYGQISTISHRFIGTNWLLSDHPQASFARFPRVLSSFEDDFFLVVWHDDSLGGEDSERVFGRLFDKDGTPRNSSFLISEDQQLSRAWTLSAALNPKTGGFAVVWSGMLDSLFQVQWRRFRSDGTPLGPSEQVNLTAEAGRGFVNVDIAYDAEGKVAVVWEQQVDRFLKVYAQRFLSDGTRFGGNFRVAMRDTAADQITPTVALLNNRIYTTWSTLLDSSSNRYIIWANILDFYDPTLRVKEITMSSKAKFSLSQSYPNPFNSATTISYHIGDWSHVRLVVYDVLGRVVRELINRDVAPGLDTAHWRGKDNNGQDVPSGLYLYRLTVDGHSQTKKMVLIR